MAGLCALSLMGFAFFVMGRGESVHVESHWGGLGGGLGGWTVSNSLACLLLAISFGAFTTALSVQEHRPDLIERFGGAIRLAQERRFAFDKAPQIDSGGRLYFHGQASSVEIQKEILRQIELVDPVYRFIDAEVRPPKQAEDGKK